MFIIVTPDELVDCGHCGGSGVIPVDVYAHTDVGFEIVRSQKWMCGVCGGEGSLLPEFEIELGLEGND
jgi:hypothetical protein